jgi:pimeloyl-ACP methyl ester carboxylesterase
MSNDRARDTVLLVHGLWLHGVSMRLIQRRLERHGYRVRSYSYPTLRLDLEQNAERLRHFCETLPPGRIHFVGHSMGGLVSLKTAQLVPAECRGRVVLVGTPFGGSYAARALERLPGGRRILGACIRQWLTAPSIERFDLCELGVIAGSRGVGLGRLIARGLPAPHDGVVTVQETRVPGMCDHIVLQVGHTEMLFSRAVAEQVHAFLEHGTFDHTVANGPSVN